MATAAVVDISRLDDGWILAPERYDPRRGGKSAGPCLGDFVRVCRDQANANTAGNARFVVFDTGDARDGIVVAHKQPCAAADLRSAKKLLRPQQVIVSRLRPYLRQVAWIDPGLLAEQGPDVQLLCSTEFFVLESATDASIAFLAPFLLSAQVQAVLAAAQEGGHHPRFNERTLTTLRVPKDDGSTGERPVGPFRVRGNASPRSLRRRAREHRHGHAPASNAVARPMGHNRQQEHEQ